jgi:hypothetical protein
LTQKTSEGRKVEGRKIKGTMSGLSIEAEAMKHVARENENDCPPAE